MDLPPVAVAPDGSPVEVFRHLPAGASLGYIEAAVDPAASVLDLGCGAGRLLHALAGAGHPVVGVDICPAMLEHVTGETVCADIVDLDLGRTFDAVVLASYLVNDPDHAGGFLATARRHLEAGGTAVVQRYDPLWLADAVEDETTLENVTVSVHSFVSTPPLISFGVGYRLGNESWEQAVRATVVDDDAMASLVEAHRFTFDTWIDPYRTWGRLTAV